MIYTTKKKRVNTKAILSKPVGEYCDVLLVLVCMLNEVVIIAMM